MPSKGNALNRMNRSTPSSAPAAAGFLAGADLSANAIERARRASPGYLDLTSSNPTRHGLIFPAQVLRAAAEPYWATRRYDPDPLGLPTARQAITRYYLGRTPPLCLQPGQVVITASTSEAYSLLFTLLADPGDNLLAPDVTIRSSSTWPLPITSPCAPIAWTNRAAGR